MELRRTVGQYFAKSDIRRRCGQNLKPRSLAVRDCRLFALLFLVSISASPAYSSSFIFYTEGGGTPLRVLAWNPGNPAAACGSDGALSAEGLYVLMTTYCSLDTVRDSGGQDMYMVPFTGSAELVTVTGNGAALGGNSFGQLIDTEVSDNRRWVTFPSNRPDIVSGSQNTYRQVYLWSADSGSVSRVTEIAGGTPGIGDSLWGFPSNDGTSVAIQTDAVNLIETYPGASNDRRFLFRNVPTGEFEHLAACGADPGYLRSYSFSEETAFVQQCITDPIFGSGPGYLLRQSPNWSDVQYAFAEDGTPREVWSAKVAAKGKVVLFWEAIIVSGSRVRGDLYARILSDARSINFGRAQDALVSGDLSAAVVMVPISDGATDWYRLRRIDLHTGQSNEIPLGRSELPGATGFNWLYLYDIGHDGRLLLLGFDSEDVSVSGDWLGGASQRYAIMVVADLSVVFSNEFE